MYKFDTKVQHLKYKVLRTVAKHAWDSDFYETFLDIPKEIISGKTPTMRCCVYKERAILAERVKLAAGGDRNNPNVIETLDIACDDCPTGGYTVTEACRGCIAHRCEDVCKRGAISFDKHQRAVIDKEKCVECGACAKVCPYSAITNHKRPCENACKVKAISRDEKTLAASIDNDKCIACGACVYQCPFGAITDKSYILDVVNLIKGSAGNTNYRLYAVVAPSISSQFSYAKLGRSSPASSGWASTMWSKRRSARTWSPTTRPRSLHNLSPAATISKYIKETDPGSRVVFIGPCTAKKAEFQKERVRPYIDSVITFEELQALFDSRNLVIESLPETSLDNASYFGRIFARSGGLTDAVRQALIERGLDKGFEYRPISCDGIEQCRAALFKASKNVLPNNFIEGMACVGGCIGGAGCLTHGEKDKTEVDKYGQEALEKSISDSIGVYFASKDAKAKDAAGGA